jgi:two-component system, NtrC family, nitrogen regulation response regulator GlnG
VTKRTLLIAEDNPALLHLYENVLPDGHFKILTADNGNLLYFELEHEPVDLLISDTRIPDLPLPEWVGRIHRKQPELPIVLVDEDLKDIWQDQTAKECGIKAYLRKPVNLWVLKRIISEILFPFPILHS